MDGEIVSIRINDYLARYRLFVEQENRANRYNINIRAESFFIPIIKSLYSCSDLENLNIEDKNFPGLDLGDRKKRIAFQITSDVSSSKVIKCLEKFSSEKFRLYKDFDILVIFMLQNRQESYTSKKIDKLIKEIKIKNNSFLFPISENIVDFRIISTKINDFAPLIKNQIHEALMLEIDGDFLSPLSKKPISPRQIIDISLVKREKEYQRLKESHDDFLIIGQPGIGKTFLLYKLALENDKAYFVNNDSKFNLSKAISIIQPEILFIDDAHKCPNLISDLRFIRDNSTQKFRIIASCWPTEKREIVNHYGQFNSENCIELEKLSKDDLAKLLILLLKKYDFKRTPYLEQQIIDQSIGSPGILVGLFLLFKEAKGEDVLSGRALLTHLTNIALETRTEIEWKKTKRLLAYFSIGGTSGMSSTEISKAVDLSIFEIETILSTFNYGGIINDIGDRIIIRPPLLQAILVKEEFFVPVNSRRIESLLALVGNKYECLLTILYAASIGAEISDSWLVEQLEKTDSENLWEQYYGFFPKKIIQRLSQFPNTLNACVYPGLMFEPDFVLPLLLETMSLAEEKEDRNFESNLKKITYWVNSDVNSDQTIIKREKLIAVILHNHDAINDSLKISILAIIFSPGFEYNHVEPGSGNKVVFSFGIFSNNIIEKIFLLWPTIYLLLKEIDSWKYSAFINTILNWAYPTRIISQIDEKIIQKMNENAIKILWDMILISQNHPALLLQYKGILKDLSSDIDIKIDPFYLTLFPDSKEYLEDTNNPIYIQDVKKLSLELVHNSIEDVCQKLIMVNKESELANKPWPCLIPNLCYELAAIVENPIKYANQFIQSELPVEVVAPFFEVAVKKNYPEWRTFSDELLPSPIYYLIICNTVFLLEEPPEDVLTACINRLDDKNSGWIEFFCMQHTVPINVMKQLLLHTNSKIAYSAAIGDWHANPKGKIRDEIYELWEKAISKSPEDDLFIKEILVSNPSIAFQWLLNYFSKDHFFIGHEMVNPIAASIQVLDKSQRKDLLEKLIKSENQLEKKEKIISWIVGEDLELFEYLLNIPIIEKQRKWCIAPLQMLPNENDWCKKTLIALENGVNENDVINASFLGLFEKVYSGSTSNQYKIISEAYELLKNHENEKIKKIATIGYSIAQDSMSVHLREEAKKEDLE